MKNAIFFRSRAFIRNVSNFYTARRPLKEIDGIFQTFNI